MGDFGRGLYCRKYGNVNYHCDVICALFSSYLTLLAYEGFRIDVLYSTHDALNLHDIVKRTRINEYGVLGHSS